VVSCSYLLFAFKRATKTAPLDVRPSSALKITKENLKSLFAVGIPSTMLTALLDISNVVLNALAAAHSDLVLAGIGIVMKIERVPNAINIGISQGMLPIVAYNYASGNRERMQKTINTARRYGLTVSAVSIVLFLIFAPAFTRLFLATGTDPQAALTTLGFAALFLRIRCLAAPVQFLNFHTSYCMQAMGNGKGTLVHSIVRQLVFYIPFMYILNALFGYVGLTFAIVAGEGCGAMFALWLLRRYLKKLNKEKTA
jgi:Na+-driven multidrug efflux pump